MLILSVLSCFLLFVTNARIDVAVNATVGESAVLPCNLQIPTPIALEYLRCYWQDGKNKVLYSLNEGKEMPQHATEPYRGRITAFPPDMITGNISVELESTTIEDDNKVFQAFAAVRGGGGTGKSTLGHTLICQITLHVAAPYENVSLAVDEETMKAVCTTQRGYPPPSVTWSLQHLANDSQHSVDPRDVRTTSTQDPRGHLYSVRSTIDVPVGEYRSVTCLIYNPTLNVTLSPTHVFNKGEAEWSLPGWLIAAAVVLSLSCGAGGFIAYKKKKYWPCRQNGQTYSPPDQGL